jgi:transcriptional regulator with XRE-family HTH domain
MRQPLSKKLLAKARKLFDDSGMTYDQLGQKMGYESGTARRAVWQLFNKITDPRLSTLEALATALKVDLKDLL